jgi:hypothetical protein
LANTPETKSLVSSLPEDPQNFPLTTSIVVTYKINQALNDTTLHLTPQPHNLFNW